MTANPQERRLLLVEDDTTLRTLLARRFRSLGFDVTEAADAEAAWSAAESAEFAFDVVISDVHLPGASGVNLAHRLQAHDPTQAVVLITGDSDDRLAAEALGSCVTSYLLKPFELFELEAAVMQAVSRRDFLSALNTSHAAVPARSEGSSLSLLLQVAEDSCGAGAGHGYRTALFARQLTQRFPGQTADAELDDLEVAARSHEVGRLLAPGDDARAQSFAAAEFLHNAGAAGSVAEILRLKEVEREVRARAGEAPRRLAVALQAADRLDHALARATASGLPLSEAVQRAVQQLPPDYEAEGGSLQGLSDWLMLVLSLADDMTAAA